MAKRKKRLEKGIASLEKQVILHKDKQQSALEAGNLYLADYYAREIAAKERDRQRKQDKIMRKTR